MTTRMWTAIALGLLLAGGAAAKSLGILNVDQIKAASSVNTILLTATTVTASAAATVTTALTAATGIFTTGAVVGGSAIASQAGPFQVVSPASQTIAAGNTIAANACGTIKKITAAGGVTTDTTNTFTVPAAANKDCCMDVVNVGAQAITLDFNGLFVSAGAADVVLGAGDSVLVCSTGASGAWYQIGGTGNN